MRNTLYRLFAVLLTWGRREEGQTFAEYGILLAFLAIIVLAAALFLGGKIFGLFHQLFGRF